MRRGRRHIRATATGGFTMLEILVVVALIGALVMLLLPAVQSAREAARRMKCSNNLKQLGLGLHNYENTLGAFPPALVMSGSGNAVTWFGGWSVHGRILPFMEQGPMFDAINFATAYSHPQNVTVSAQMLDVFLCPSEVNSEVSQHDFGPAGITNYGFNRGDWYVWGGFDGPRTRGAFTVNRSRKVADFRDGMSQTLVAAEVKTYQPYYRDCGGLANVADPMGNYAPAADPFTLVPEYGGSCGNLRTSSHTEWVDGHVHQSGFTTAWPPNKAITSADDRHDLDITGQREKNGGPTFAAVNSRSWHPGGVNALLGDGSVTFVKETIGGVTWRALGTLKGGEVLGEDSY